MRVLSKGKSTTKMQGVWALCSGGCTVSVFTGSMFIRTWFWWSQHLDNGGVSSQHQHTTTNTKQRVWFPETNVLHGQDMNGSVDSWKKKVNSTDSETSGSNYTNLCVLFVWQEQSGKWSSCLVASRMVEAYLSEASILPLCWSNVTW